MCSPIKKKGVNDYASASCSAASNTVNQQTCSHYVSVDALKTDIVGYEMLCFTRSKKIHIWYSWPKKIIFLDSNIVNEISLKRTKTNYVVSYGLKEYFHEVSMIKVKKAARFTICFDEALNNILCWKRLDSQKVERYCNLLHFYGTGILKHV